MKQIKVHMTKELQEVTSTEEASKASHESIVHAKNKEIDLATKAIEKKMLRVGDVAVDKNSMANDLGDTQEGLTEDTRFLADLQTACEDSKKQWVEYQKMFGEEKLALADTINLLNRDDSLDLFKKTLPGPEAASFLQVSMGHKSRALAALRKAKHKDH